MEITDYIVIERDGLIIGCTALHSNLDEHYGTIACMAVHPDYRSCSRGNRLLDYVYTKAHALNLTTLYVLSTQTMHWFIDRGFLATELNKLPEPLKHHYNPARNSKILFKMLA